MKSGDITPISAWSDLHSWHPQGERFGKGDEKRDLGTIVGQDYPTIDLIGKVVANTLDNKSEGLSSPLRTACLFARPYFPERGREPTEQGRKGDPAISRQVRGAGSGPTEVVPEKLE